MQFTNVAAVLAVAATAYAHSNDTIVWTTLVVDSYVTVCPASSTITYQGVTYTNTLTESSTITVTNCPCTVSAPVSVATSVYCSTCAVPTTSAVVVPTTAPIYSNATTAVVLPTTTAVVLPTTTAAASATSTPSSIVGSGANKAFAMSGASLAGLLGLAAYLL